MAHGACGARVGEDYEGGLGIPSTHSAAWRWASPYVGDSNNSPSQKVFSRMKGDSFLIREIWPFQTTH